MSNVADPLREYADTLLANDLIGSAQWRTYTDIADEIDAEHGRRMQQQHDSMRRRCRVRRPRKEHQ